MTKTYTEKPVLRGH